MGHEPATRGSMFHPITTKLGKDSTVNDVLPPAAKLEFCVPNRNSYLALATLRACEELLTQKNVSACKTKKNVRLEQIQNMKMFL